MGRVLDGWGIAYFGKAAREENKVRRMVEKSIANGISGLILSSLVAGAPSKSTWK